MATNKAKDTMRWDSIYILSIICNYDEFMLEI